MLIQPLAPLDTLFLYQFFLDGLPALDGDYDKNDDGKALVALHQKKWSRVIRRWTKNRTLLLVLADARHL